MISRIATFVLLCVTTVGVSGFVLAQAQTGAGSTPNTMERESADATALQTDPVLGRVLFDHVTSVHFCGVNMPANSDGSFGAWVGEKEGSAARMTIYEKFIVKETRLPDGTTFRETRPYDRLGNIEQRIPPKRSR